MSDPVYYFEIIQGTDEWFDVKSGKVSASSVANCMMKDSTAGFRNYRAKLVAERLTGEREETFTSSEMQWGIDQEEFARAAYELETCNDVQEVGFVDHGSIESFGCSPDGLVGDDGLVEIKCPKTATHMDYLLAGNMPKDHIKQVQTQLVCTGRKWCDFVSYDPRMPIELQLFVVRVERDEDMITDIEVAVVKFLSEVEDMVESMNILIKRRS